MIRNTRKPNRPQENGIERPQLFQAVLRHHFSRLRVSLTAPVEGPPVESESESLSRGLQYANALGNHFLSDSVSRNYRNVENFHRSFLTRRLWRGAVKAPTCRWPSPASGQTQLFSRSCPAANQHTPRSH